MRWYIVALAALFFIAFVACEEMDMKRGMDMLLKKYEHVNEQQLYVQVEESTKDETVTLVCPSYHGLTCAGNGVCSNGVCSCNSGFYGYDCSIAITMLTSGNTLSGESVGKFAWKYYAITLTASGYPLRINVVSTSGDPDVFVKAGSLPSFANYDKYDLSTNDNVWLEINSASAVTYFIGVYGIKNTNAFSIMAVSDSCMNSCSGHGTCQAVVNSVPTCQCNLGWMGADCSSSVTLLSQDVSVHGSVDHGNWVFYQLPVIQGYDTLSIMVNTTSGFSDVDLYLRYNDLPTWYLYDARDLTLNPNFVVNFENPSVGNYYVGMYGFSTGSSSFTIEYYLQEDCPSDCSDHGSCTMNSCDCAFGYSDSNCGTYDFSISDGQVMTGYVANRVWNYYWFSGNTVEDIVIYLNATQLSEYPMCDLYVRQGATPTVMQYDQAILLFNDNVTLVIEDPAFANYYIGVYGFASCHYSLMIDIPQGCPGGCAHGTCVTGSTVCDCDNGWGGVRCDIPVNPLSAGQVTTGAVSNPLVTQNAVPWVYYTITTSAARLTVFVKELGSVPGSAWVFVSHLQPPSTVDYDFEDAQVKTLHTLDFETGLDKENPGTAVFVIGVHASPICQSTSFQLEVIESYTV